MIEQQVNDVKEKLDGVKVNKSSFSRRIDVVSLAESVSRGKRSVHDGQSRRQTALREESSDEEIGTFYSIARKSLRARLSDQTGNGAETDRQRLLTLFEIRQILSRFGTSTRRRETRTSFPFV